MTRTVHGRRLGWAVSVVSVAICSCAQPETAKEGRRIIQRIGDMTVETRSFGSTPDGQEVKLFTLTNAHGVKMDVTNYGCTIVRLCVPDRSGKLDDVVLGYDNLAGYIAKSPYFGAVVGRYGNRIAKGRFTLDGVEYKLATNNNENHLHGGIKGFDKAVWDAETFNTPDGVGVKFSYLSKDGDEGYPGNLTAHVTYLLTNDSEFKINYEATTDQPTPINLTQHSYWNLAGAGSRDILDHELMLNADRFTPIDKGLIPTGELRPVKGTPLDFTKPTPIGARVNQEDEQIKYGGGYDHNFVLNKDQPGEMTLAARVHEPTTGRVMEVWTTEPGVQFYCGNFLDGTIKGKGGRLYQHRYGLCLETQHFPDSPNKPSFPSVILRPGERYRQETIYRFSTK